ncbi:hypothetical protein JCM15548_12090 [Geofilum rubicundum JCM 15548]|uniref:Uncharacterized protein n=2 Tax=Geofilum TaxID=1236988 RepID=A0A0E9LX91_9BACT|nr:hypothetical protein JCM15548_12090 [Geofilum rubicundum JCM 15548]
MVARAMQLRPPKIKVSRLVTELGWRANLVLCFIAGKAPAITKDSARSAQASSKYSAEKFRQQFNYTFIPIKDAIENSAAWFKAIEK